MTTKEIWRAAPSLPDVLAGSEGRLMVVPRWEPVNLGEGMRPYGGSVKGQKVRAE